ncbi:MAG: prolipoprotein diacylglyceryl transferase [Thermodesulfobacteriota bacterium]
MKYPAIDPVLIDFGPVQIRWYGLMYVIAFFMAYVLLRRFGTRAGRDLGSDEVGDLLGYCVIGVIAGARLGYCLFYNLPYYLGEPLRIFAVWEGGMSFHGGLTGAMVSGWMFALRRKKAFLMLADLGGLVAPVGLFFGRLGNFINGELYGRVTTVPWGMVFPGGGGLPRHPSQLYEALLEGPALFLVLALLGRRDLPMGFLFASFLSGYGLIRFVVEFFREPDAQLGFILGPLTMGQLLSLLMIALGMLLCQVARMLHQKRRAAKAEKPRGRTGPRAPKTSARPASSDSKRL